LPTVVIVLRRAFTAVPAMAVAALLAGCAGGDSPAPGAPGEAAAAAAPSSSADPPGLKVYHHSMDEAPSSLDPVQAATVYANHVLENTLDTHYAYKYLARPYELKPNLADGWPWISPDLLTYRIRIKPGGRFQDDPAFPGGKGREVTAADFVYSLKRNFDPKNRPQGAWFWQGRIVGLDAWKDAGSDYDQEVEGLRALDDHTIQVILTRPYPQLLDTFAQGYSGVVPREAVEYYGREFAVHPVGSGPFKLVAYDSARAVLDRNPHYRQEPVDLAAEGYDPATQRYTGVERIAGRSPPFVDRIVVDFARDTASGWNSFLKGDEIQYTVLPAEKDEAVLASKDPVRLKPEYAEKYQLYSGPEAGFVFEAFNFSFPEVGYHPDPERNARNKALRCAIMKAFDWQARNDIWYGGIATVFPGVIVPVSPEYDPDTPRDSVNRDVEGARRLLREAGWTAENLPVLVYGQAAGVKQRMFYEQFRGWLAEIGYPPEKVKSRYYATFGDLSRAWKQNQLPIIGKGWGLDFPDAENTLQLFYGPNGSPGSNDANYRNPEFDRLYEQAATMLPSPERTAIYRRMNRLLLEDCVGMTGLSRNRIYLWHKNVVFLPDREITGGFSWKYVDVLPKGESARPPDLEPGGDGRAAGASGG
jgi:ABC-type transport system substrate-binding protein